MMTQFFCALLAGLCLVIVAGYIVELRKVTADYSTALAESQKGMDRYEALRYIKWQLFNNTLFLIFFLVLAVYFTNQFITGGA